MTSVWKLRDNGWKPGKIGGQKRKTFKERNLIFKSRTIWNNLDLLPLVLKAILNSPSSSCFYLLIEQTNGETIKIFLPITIKKQVNVNVATRSVWQFLKFPIHAKEPIIV